MQEATTVSPLESNSHTLGLVKTLEAFDPSVDFQAFTKRYLSNDSRTRAYDKSDIKYKEYSSSIISAASRSTTASLKSESPTPPLSTTTASSSSKNSDPSPYFAVDLARQLERDNREVPLVVERCVEFIESSGGLDTSGIYRVPGSTSIVAQLRREFVMGESTDLSSLTRDPHDVTSLLKMFFRQLPEPLFTSALYPRLLAACRDPVEDAAAARARVIAVHELVNLLPDANYATLRALTKHLWTVAKHESETLMNASNLGIVWGPTLLEGDGSKKAAASDVTSGALEFKHQAKVVEVVVSNYEGIFEM